MTAAIIINPISGTGGHPTNARRRAELAANTLAARRIAGEVLVSAYPGHTRELTRAALEQGASLIVAWGGDGTVNEVASVLAFGDAAIAVIPSGSGNGLARELRIPFDPAGALAIAFDGRDHMMDAGELDGRLFFNVAGVGLDARVAYQFAVNGLVRRGFTRYLGVAARELFTFEPDEHTVIVDGDAVRGRHLLVAIANSRQYGNGALIAPDARIDDGRLDVVVIDHRPPWAALWQVPKLFTGRIAEVPGVRLLRGTDVEVTSSRQVLYHVDGEPFVGGVSIVAKIHPNALRVRVPPDWLAGRAPCPAPAAP